MKHHFILITVLFILLPLLGFGQFAKKTSVSPLENKVPFKKSLEIKEGSFIKKEKVLGLKAFKYTAFFCRMEQKSINKLGVCLQFHAGRYNTYYKDKRYLDD